MNEWIEYGADGAVINLSGVVQLLFHKLWSILIISILFGGAMFGYSNYVMTPLYQSSVKMYVNNSTDTSGTTAITSSDITASKNLVDTYSVILKSYPTLSEVIKKTNVDYTYEELADMITTSAVDNTEVVRVTVISPNAEEAAVLANAIADIAPGNITDIVVGSSVSIVENARPATKKSLPNVRRLTLVGWGIGFIFACLLVLLQSLVKNRISVEERIRTEFNVPVLASIPEIGKRKKMAELGDKMEFSASEAYKLLRTNLAFCFSDEQDCKVLGITSSISGEGKSTTAINLAYTLAQAGHKVCLIDCDMRAAGTSRMLQLKRKQGLSNLLSRQVKGQEVIDVFSLGETSFYVIGSGAVPPNPSELLGSVAMEQTIKGLRKSCDYIVLDLPPVGLVSDSLNVTKLVGGVVFVVHENRFDRRVYSESMRMFQNVNAKILGTVVTHSSILKKQYNQYKTNYGYGYGETKRGRRMKRKDAES